MAEAVATEADGGETMTEEVSNEIEGGNLRCQIGTSNDKTGLRERAQLVSQNVIPAEGADGRAGHEDDTLEAWLDHAQKARERMAIDEEYRKQIARGIS